MRTTESPSKIQGEGRLIGVDNGDMANSEDYKGAQKKAFHGHVSGHGNSRGAKAGQIRVIATSPGLKVR